MAIFDKLKSNKDNKIIKSGKYFDVDNLYGN